MAPPHKVGLFLQAYSIFKLIKLIYMRLYIWFTIGMLAYGAFMTGLFEINGCVGARCFVGLIATIIWVPVAIDSVHKMRRE